MDIVELILVKRTLRVAVVGPPSTVACDMPRILTMQSIAEVETAAAVVAEIAHRNQHLCRIFRSTLSLL